MNFKFCSKCSMKKVFSNIEKPAERAKLFQGMIMDWSHKYEIFTRCR